jgi:16S rRNA (uracil1498-N3)-methyltransferase
LQAGASVTVLDGCGRVAEGIVESLDRQGGVIALQSVETSPPPVFALTVIASVIRSERMEWMIQKCTELGVARIIPLLTEHAVVRFRDERQQAKRLERWRMIAGQALKQCGHPWQPEITPLCSVGTLADVWPERDPLLLCSLKTAPVPLRVAVDALRSGRVTGAAVVVGPEGDFTDDEERQWTALGARAVDLGPTVLRAETAAIYAASVLAYEFLR